MRKLSSKVSLEGGTLRLENNVDSNNVDRLADSIPLTVNNGTLEFVHTGGAANYSEAAIAGNNGAKAFTKTGLGALIFNGLVDMTGAAAVQEGTLTFGSVAGQPHQLGSMVVTGGAERPTLLNVDGPMEIINFGNIIHASISGDRCVMNIANILVTSAGAGYGASDTLMATD